MTWHKALPPALPLSRTCCWSRAGRTLSPQTLDLSKTLFRPPPPSRSAQRKEWPKALLAADLDAGSPGPVCQSFVLYIYLFIWEAGDRAHGMGLG